MDHETADIRPQRQLIKNDGAILLVYFLFSRVLQVDMCDHLLVVDLSLVDFVGRLQCLGDCTLAHILQPLIQASQSPLGELRCNRRPFIEDVDFGTSLAPAASFKLLKSDGEFLLASVFLAIYCGWTILANLIFFVESLWIFAILSS